jgi:bifunctional non-homologous end joining protein LigD
MSTRATTQPAGPRARAPARAAAAAPAPGRGGLDTYRRMRDFRATPEPRGEPRAARRPGLRFVVQRHAASHLHFDFRLEWEGVLKSWAVPKGPSSDPGDRRLAVEVEDHPLEYAGFSGTIPAGQYGAGEVTIWDHGTWAPEDEVAAGLERGKLEFTLAGRRLRGRWLLVRTRATGRKPSWLLMKRRDDFAGRGTAPAEALARGRGRAATRPKAAARGAGGGTRTAHRAPARAPGRAAMPGLQLATRVESLPRSGRWLAELKLDGYRLLVHARGDRVQCWTRNGKDWTARLPGIVAAIARLRLEDSWLDGELVSTDEHGHAQFRLLQQAFDAANGREPQWVAFDLLRLAGTDVTEQPQHERQRLLAGALAGLRADDPVRVAESVGEGIEALWKRACRQRLEGLILKDPEAPYVAGRTAAWLKVKCRHEEEFVVGGYTRTGTGRPTLSALLLGVHEDDGRLRFVGRVGSGFDTAQLGELRGRLDRLRRSRHPFAAPPKLRAGERAVWVAPQLVVQVRFAEWTDAGLLRQPMFLGLREDKTAGEVRADADRRPDAPPAVPRRRPRRGGPRAAASPGVEVATLTHPDRVLFPGDGLTKADLLSYYTQVREALWPQLERRPVSVLRAAGGGKSFFQRHAADEYPQLFAAVPAGARDEPWMRLRSGAAIPGLAQPGIVELHTWGARTPRLDRADRLVFDLDPDPGLDWASVRVAALQLHELLQELGLEARLKTSGGAGLHLEVPLAPVVTFDVGSDFSARLARHLERRFPERFTARRGAGNRTGRVFVDWQRNQYAASTVAAWSPRLRRGAPVSMPLDWDELGEEDLRFAHFNLHNAPQRLATLGDPWARRPLRPQRLGAAIRARVEALGS